MLEQLMNNPYAWTVLSILTIFSVAYAIYTYRKSKEKKEFSYSQKSSTLILKKKSKFEKLSIVYDGQQIDDLCVSKFTIWNSGNRTLNSDDMVDSKELTITAIDGNKILDTEIIICSEKTNKFSIKIIDDYTAKIFFNYVDQKDGFVMQVIHTGTSDSLQVNYKIKGGMPIKNIDNETIPKIFEKSVNKDKLYKCMLIATATMLFLILIIAIFFSIAIFSENLQVDFLAEPAASPRSQAITMSITFWIYELIMGSLFFPIFKKAFSIGIPKGLKRYSGFTD